MKRTHTPSNKAFFGALFACLIFYSTNSNPVTLGEVVTQALTEHPAVLAAEANEMQSQFAIKRAQGGYYPQVDVRMARGREISDNSFVRQALGKESYRLNRQEHSIVLNQMLFDGWRVKNQVEQQDYNLKAANFSYENSRQTLIRDIAIAYINVLRARELLLLSANNVHVHFTILDAIRLRFKGGAGTSGEVILAESRQELAKLRHTEAQGTEKRNNSRYFALTGFLPPENMQMPKPLKSYLPHNVNEAADAAMAYNPSLNQAREEEKAVHSEVGIAKSSFMPRLNLEMSASDNNNIDGVPGRNRDFLAAFTINYSVFKGGSDLAQLNQARSRVLEKRQDIENTRRNTLETIVRYWSDLQTDLNRYQRQKAYVDYSKKVVADYKEQFQLGKRALFNVLDAEDELYRARTGLSDAYYDSLLDTFQILAAMGVLSERML